MQFEILLAEDAQRDVEDLYDHIAAHDNPQAHVLDHIENALENLAKFPGRGAHPKELLALGVREYRQTYFKPYRMIYRIVGRQVSTCI